MTEEGRPNLDLSEDDIKTLNTARDAVRDLLINVSKYLEAQDISVDMKGWKQFAINRELALFALFMSSSNLSSDFVDIYLDEMKSNVKSMLLKHAEAVKHMHSGVN